MANIYKTIDVKLPFQKYRILIGSGIIDTVDSHVTPLLLRKKIAIITDETISRLYLSKLLRRFENDSIDCEYLVLPCGEKSKSWKILSKTVEWLIEKRIERDDIVLAFGGGVIGDLVGFAASIVRRGVSVVQIPTTLLSQVDSSVGGKTGINSKNGKNLIGTFHQPTLVIIDTNLLKTLPTRDFLSGYSEVIKYGLLGDKKFFQWLDKNSESLLKGDSDSINYAVWKSCKAKAKIVIADEKEKGQRALLNLGHTFGHALEASTNFSNKLLHGEGVSIGCILAFKFSWELGFCDKKSVELVQNHFKSVGLKTDFKDIHIKLPQADDFINLMMNDKKVKSGMLNLILVNKIGSAFVSKDVSLQRLRSFLARELD